MDKGRLPGGCARNEEGHRRRDERIKRCFRQVEHLQLLVRDPLRRRLNRKQHSTIRTIGIGYSTPVATLRMCVMPQRASSGRLVAASCDPRYNAPCRTFLRRTREHAYALLSKTWVLPRAAVHPAWCPQQIHSQLLCLAGRELHQPPQ